MLTSSTQSTASIATGPAASFFNFAQSSAVQPWQLTLRPSTTKRPAASLRAARCVPLTRSRVDHRSGDFPVLWHSPRATLPVGDTYDASRTLCHGLRWIYAARITRCVRLDRMSARRRQGRRELGSDRASASPAPPPPVPPMRDARAACHAREEPRHRGSMTCANGMWASGVSHHAKEAAQEPATAV